MTEKSVTEASNEFYLEFKAEYQVIQLEIEQAREQSKANLTIYFNNILQKINNLEKKLTKATEFIPSYDERQCFKQLKELSQQLETVKSELTPKTKFSFKSRKKKTEKESPKTTTTKEKENTVDVVSEATVLLQDKQNTVLLLRDDQNKHVQGKSIDVLLSNIRDSVILLQDPHVEISAIHVKQVENCVIYCGQIHGSILIYGMKNSTLFIGCHQLRMHEAHQVQLMLHVTSRPIIEDSDQIKVGAWNINASTNYYDQFEDFNWLKKQASPHWSILTQEQQELLLNNVEHIIHNNDHVDIMSKRSLLLSI